jgi:type VI secretion system ImpM family protein
LSKLAVTSETRRQPRAFCLGKLPQYADFVGRGLPAPEADSWLELLSQGLAAAREQIGESFDSAHDSAPSWRFVSGPGEFGPDWRAGAIAPSVDRSGRRFFFVAAVDRLDWRQAIAHGAWLTRNLEEAVYRAVGENLSIEAAIAMAEEALCCFDDDTEAALEMLAKPCIEGVWWTGGGERYSPRVLTGAKLNSDLVAGFIVPAAFAAAQ